MTENDLTCKETTAKYDITVEVTGEWGYCMSVFQASTSKRSDPIKIYPKNVSDI